MRNGIIATLQKGVRNKLYPRGPRVFFFATQNQGAIEQAMALMGFGSRDYWLSMGKMQRNKE